MHSTLRIRNFQRMSDIQSAQEVLRRYWGFDSFRSMQSDVISSVLAQRDCLALMPTGGGKSICYQIPALMSDGVCHCACWASLNQAVSASSELGCFCQHATSVLREMTCIIYYIPFWELFKLNFPVLGK